MDRVHYEIRFNTPAFLGDAAQSGRWRTPPFKSQLRQWWRIAYAQSRGFRVGVKEMRLIEGLIFGNAWLDGAYCKSLVRLRLDPWNEGTLKQMHWPKDQPVAHPEVGPQVGSALYLGYGPLNYDNQRKGTVLKPNAAIQAEESAKLSLAWPERIPAALLASLEETSRPLDGGLDLGKQLQQALWLMDRYGTVGGRSRNAWGSYRLQPIDGTRPLAGTVPLRPWEDCLNLDWPHAIGRDGQGALIWETEPHADWHALMKTLAGIKIGLRTQFAFTTGRNAPRPEDRHWLSYPVTNHDVQGWNQLRLPNQLRFKVRRREDGRLVGAIFHIPHSPPPSFAPQRQAVAGVWQRVHRFLDRAPGLKRIPE